MHLNISITNPATDGLPTVLIEISFVATKENTNEWTPSIDKKLVNGIMVGNLVFRNGG
jgi:hypothetical protein